MTDITGSVALSGQEEERGPARNQEEINQRAAKLVNNYQLQSLPIDIQNEILLGLEDDLAGTDIRINGIKIIEDDTGGARFAGYIRSENTIFLTREFVDNPEKMMALARQSFEDSISERLERYDMVLLENLTAAERNRYEGLIERWSSAPRWTVGSSEGSNAVAAHIRHETAHVIDDANQLKLSEALWEATQEIKDKRLYVSEYALSAKHEFFAETYEAVKTGISIPTEIAIALAKIMGW